MCPLNIALRHRRVEVVSMLLLEFEAKYDHYCHDCTQIGEFQNPIDCHDWFVHDKSRRALDEQNVTQKWNGLHRCNPGCRDSANHPGTTPFDQLPSTTIDVAEIVAAHTAYEEEAEHALLVKLGIDPISETNIELDLFEFYNGDPHHFSTSIITNSKWYQQLREPQEV
ncbi:hypothetical protein BJ508DRAFT_30242 [Ascobolus immersus RN42]|uniref:Uncharacterized protein n=1 Tax=Ascobolus immersus RN42 TaxID=1160509 RepID=A0A3N4HRU9_ASCIM|nr:hypothetical protein BJ508DRAFT_30242 [Ascobolus immersus RN42]